MIKNQYPFFIFRDYVKTYVKFNIFIPRNNEKNKTLFPSFRATNVGIAETSYFSAISCRKKGIHEISIGF